MSIIHNIKYLELVNDNSLKTPSLEDNVYFTLRDIYMNISEVNYCLDANTFNNQLTNYTYYGDRTNDFQYTNVLHDKQFVSKLYNWLNSINKLDFEFNELTKEEESLCNMTHLIKFDDWWSQLQHLKFLLFDIKQKLTI